jgi:hypothetical protein
MRTELVTTGLCKEGRHSGQIDWDHSALKRQI